MKAKGILVAVFVIASLSLCAQGKANFYWVVEGNARQPNFTIVHYYDAHHQKMAEERIEGKWLDISRRKNVKFLNRRLQKIIRQDSLAGKRRERKELREG